MSRIQGWLPCRLNGGGVVGVVVEAIFGSVGWSGWHWLMRVCDTRMVSMPTEQWTKSRG